MQYTPENLQNPDNSLPIDQILCGDNLELIQKLPDCSIQLVITSPPYFQQRDYGGGMGNETEGKFARQRVSDTRGEALHLFKELLDARYEPPF